MRLSVAMLGLAAGVNLLASGASAQTDTAGPELVDFTVEPQAVETSSDDATLQWCATIRDDRSGPRRIVVFLPGTLGPDSARDEVVFTAEPLEQTACGILTLARGTPKGPHALQVYVQDHARNAVDYVSGDNFDESGGPSSASVRLLCPIGPCKIVNRP
jgi:hypothetical protein